MALIEDGFLPLSNRVVKQIALLIPSKLAKTLCFSPLRSEEQSVDHPFADSQAGWQPR